MSSTITRGALIGEHWQSTGQAAVITSPYDDREVGSVYLSDAEDVEQAIEAAGQALKNDLPPWQRAEVLHNAAARLGDEQERLARIIEGEAGKPIKQARVEAARASETLRLSAIEAETSVGQMVPLHAIPAAADKVAYTIRVPLGVVAAITPFNFPLNLVAHKLGPALAAGNAVVLKPASQTPLSAIALAEILLEAGLPVGRLQIVIGPGSEVGHRLVTDPGLAAISFTGSREVGWDIAGTSRRPRVFLELGSTSPVIVCADSDWQRAASLISQHGFSFAGQSCISVQRVLVEASICDDFVSLLTDSVQRLQVGDPAEEGTDVGPLIDHTARERVMEWISEASEGGEMCCGGLINEDGTVQPTVINNPPTESRVWREEVFGPVVGVRSFDDFSAAIEACNDSIYGLQAGVFTRDLNHALQATQQLEFGGVLINEVPTVRADMQPYGGTKDSGRGREGPAWAVREFSEERFISWQAG